MGEVIQFSPRKEQEEQRAITLTDEAAIEELVSGEMRALKNYQGLHTLFAFLVFEGYSEPVISVVEKCIAGNLRQRNIFPVVPGGVCSFFNKNVAGNRVALAKYKEQQWDMLKAD